MTISRPSLPDSLSGLCPFLGDDDNETLNNILACKWSFDEPEFVDTSDEAKDFISRMLITNKGYFSFYYDLTSFRMQMLTCGGFKKNISLCLFISWRMGASEALRHPWLSDPVLHHRLNMKVE